MLKDNINASVTVSSNPRQVGLDIILIILLRLAARWRLLVRL